MALVMVAEGARNETADQMGKVLRFPDAFRNFTSDASTRPWNLSPLHSGLAALNERFTGVNRPDLAPLREKIDILRKQLDETNREAEESRQANQWRRHESLARKSQELADKLNELLPQVDQYEIRLANALWGEETYPHLKSYVDTVGIYYKPGGIFSLGFRGNYSRSIDRINAWVEEQTNQRIRNLISKDVLSEEERKRLCLVLTNAVYFRGEWAEIFPATETKDDDFMLAAGGKIEVPMMHCSMDKSRYGAFDADGSFFDTPREIPYGPGTTPAKQPSRYPAAGGFTILELPYKGDDLSMVIIVPRSADGMPALQKKLTASTFEEWLGKLERRTVDVYLPRFRLDTTYNMSKTLASMGMTRAFVNPLEPAGAQFDGMCASQDPQLKAFISQVLHRAFVEVTEEGTQAAAGTVIMMPPPPAIPEMVPFDPTFRADKPFLFLIRDTTSGSILFLGRMTKPEITG
jgi:serine protease inhibitor